MCCVLLYVGYHADMRRRTAAASYMLPGMLAILPAYYIVRGWAVTHLQCNHSTRVPQVAGMARAVALVNR